MILFMLRGCSKRVIHIKNTGSAYFDEAYFVVSARAGASDGDMVREASRIVDDNLVSAYLANPVRRRMSSRVLALAAFTAGVAVCAICAVIIVLAI